MFRLPCALLVFALLFSEVRAEVVETDVLVFGGTAAGVSAACTAARFGKKAVVTEFGKHIGGLTSGGLGWTDIGNKAAIGGFAHDFYKRLGKHYDKPEAWFFEPSVAERELRELLAEAKVPAYFEQRLASVKKDGARIVEIAMENGNVFRAKQFIDCTYEGDLMAKAGVKYLIGREANARFGETLNGIREATPFHQFSVAVDPYVKPRDPASGLLPFVQPTPFGQVGDGDASVQAYNFRLCLTKKPENKKPINPPPEYDPKRYELFGRYCVELAKAGKKLTLRSFLKIDMVTPEKTDINNNGGFSTDYIGLNHNYPEADYATRAAIWKEHLEYIQGFLTFLGTDPRVPENVRAEMQEWGLCQDEFQDTDGWPHALYVREARRLLSDFVMTEKVCRHEETPEDAVGLGAYNMDSHNCRRLVRDGKVENEGDVEVGVKPYPVSYRSIVPRQAECENLFVPVCLSATHIAYGSIRMEPVFMILAQSSATAASMAIDAQVPVQKIAYPKLKEQLLKDGQVLAWTGKEVRPAPPAPRLPGIVLDDSEAQQTGSWVSGSISESRRIGTGYIHDDNANKGACSVRWTPEIPTEGEYEIVLHFPPFSNRATNVPVTVEAGGKTSRTTVNERDPKGTAVLGSFKLAAGKSVTVTLSNTGTAGHVVADGLQLLKH
jgi:hypothetical protein